MKKLLYLSVLLIILSCESQLRKIKKEDFTIFSISLIKKGEYNDDLLTCSFKADQPSIFINKLKDFGIKDVTYPIAEKLGLSFSRWKVAKHNTDSTIFTLGLFINNLQITSLSNDSIKILTQKLKSDPRITIIFENSDSIKLERNDLKTEYIEDYFSINDTNWTGATY